MTQRPRQRSNSQVALSARVEDHDRRIEDLETRLNKYDAIIVRLDTLIDILTKRVESTAQKAEDAIEGQEIIKERNEGAHRWSTATVAIASSLICSILMFILGYVLR